LTNSSSNAPVAAAGGRGEEASLSSFASLPE